MKSFWHSFVLIVILLAACQQTPEPQELPTVAVLASPSATEANTEAPTATTEPATESPASPTEALNTEEVTTTSASPSPEASGTAAATALPTLDAATAVVLSTRVAAAELTPRILTLTPVPPGGNAPVQTTPQVMADIVITQRQFQSAVDRANESIPAIDRAEINFTPGRIDVDLTALAGQAFVTGRVEVLVQVSGGFAAISLGDVSVNAAEPSEDFLLVTNSDFFNMIIDVLDTLLSERVGDTHNLESLILTDTALEVFLLIPES